MKRLLFSFCFIAFQVSLSPLWAQNDDIEVTDSTSTDWGDGGGGGLNPGTPTGPVTSITLSQTSVTLAGGESVRLVAAVNNDAANKRILWTSANNDVATVSGNGTVQAWKKGSVVIAATAEGNTSIRQTCLVTVTSDYKGMVVPSVPFEFCYNAFDYKEDTHIIPNHPMANLADNSLQLTVNFPTFVNGELLRINSRCEAYIDAWEKGSSESGTYFFRQGQDCLTIVAKVAPRLNVGSCDFLANRGGGYNYMWRIGNRNSSYLHTGTSYRDSRSLVLNSEEPQLLSVRVNGPEDYILLQNLTTGEQKKIDGVNWGGGNNVFKLFYNDSGEYYIGDFYWVYYSFELLTDDQLSIFLGIRKGDVNGDGEITAQDASLIQQFVARKFGADAAGFNVAAADVNGDGDVNAQDASLVQQYVAKKISW